MKTRKLYTEEWLYSHGVPRRCMFNVDANKAEDSDVWRIHMHADWVPSEDVTTVMDPLEVMLEMHFRYLKTMKEKGFHNESI